MHFTLSDLVADIAQNAAESGATVVEAEVEETEREFRFSIRDNGAGMTEAELRRARDPFHTDGKKHPNRKVGLGIPFLIQTAETSGGGWELKSEKGVGTTVAAWFDTANLDTPPAGDLPGLLRTILLYPGPSEVVLRRSARGDRGAVNYEVRKSELLDVLGNLEDAGALVLLDRYLRSLESADGADED